MAREGLTQLTEREWRERAAAHAARVAPWIEPRLERRGDEVSTPLASSARRDTDDRGVVEKMKEKARDVKEDIDRTI